MRIINHLKSNGKSFLKKIRRISGKIFPGRPRGRDGPPGAAAAGEFREKRDEFRGMGSLFLTFFLFLRGRACGILQYLPLAAFFGGPGRPARLCPAAAVRRVHWKNLFQTPPCFSAGDNTGFKGTVNCCCGRSGEGKTETGIRRADKTAPCLSGGWIHSFKSTILRGIPHPIGDGPLRELGGPLDRQVPTLSSRRDETAWACLRNCSAPVPSGK